jgi:hypothetical protein
MRRKPPPATPAEVATVWAWVLVLAAGLLLAASCERTSNHLTPPKEWLDANRPSANCR